jgi:hypothetical protein
LDSIDFSSFAVGIRAALKEGRQKENLMSRETREPGSERNRRAKRTLRVIVHASSAIPNPIQPRRIRLTDAVSKVVWQCNDLPPGATLLIRFREDPRGPFFHLEFFGNRVIGYGNRGPADTAKKYLYDAAVQHGAAVETLDSGVAFNESPVVEAPLGPPWLIGTEVDPEDPDGSGGEGDDPVEGSDGQEP